MDVKATVGPIQQQEVDTIVIYAFEGMGMKDHPQNAAKALNAALSNQLQELIDNGDFSGKSGEVSVIYTRGAIPAKRVIIVGLGPKDNFTAESARSAAAVGLKKARDLKSQNTATITIGSGFGGLTPESSAQAVTEGALLGLYNYHGLKTKDAPEDLPQSLTIAAFSEQDQGPVEQGIKTGKAIANGVTLARDLVNMPPNYCTPTTLAQRAVDMAQQVGLRAEVLEESQMRALKMGSLLAVAQGSDAPPRFIILEHNADKAKELETIVLVGKGVTFDTGGYNLKTSEGMSTMKVDMAGAAAVIGAMRTIAELNIPLHVVGLAPAVDNMISGRAYRASEVVTASNGKTIEVISTDAEGRMILADALVYAGRYKPAAVVDIATLTGAIMVALGYAAAGLFCTDDRLRDALIAAGNSTNEKVWLMPLFPEYEKMLESPVADLKHAGGRPGGAATAAMFLKNFADYPAWAHVDMAAMANDLPDIAYVPSKGASGYGVRLFTEFVRQWAQSK